MSEAIRSQPLWTTINPVPAAYSWLTEDITVDIAVIGGGVTGALCALKLQEEGLETALLCDGPIGYGGTAESSGTVHYETPGGMSRLAESIGIDRAVRVLTLCRKGMEELEELIHDLDCDCGVRRSDSLLFAAQEGEVNGLRQEYLLRRHNGFAVEYLARERAKDLFSFDISTGIVSKRTSLSIDPYRFTHALLAYAVSRGLRVYENTSVREVSCAPDVQHLITDTGKTVRCGRLILAVGSGAKTMLPAVSGTRTTFAVATEPVSIFAGWPGKCAISNFEGTMHFSVTPDNRIVAVGLDSGMAGVRGRRFNVIPAEAFHEKKYNQLTREINRMFPGIRDADIAASFCSDYPITPHDLPIIGPNRSHPGCIFAICGGINGLAFAPVAARHVLEMVLEKENPDHTIFSARRV